MKLPLIALALAASTCSVAAQMLDAKSVGPALSNVFSMGVESCLADARCKEIATRSPSGLVNGALRACAERGPTCQEVALQGMAFLREAYPRR